MAAVTNHLASEPAPRVETEAERVARLAHERALLDEARGDVLAGRVVANEDVDARSYLFVRGESLPMPAASSKPRAK